MTPLPLAVTDKTAAAMLDMPAARFRRLVDAGALPGPFSYEAMNSILSRALLIATLRMLIADEKED